MAAASDRHGARLVFQSANVVIADSVLVACGARSTAWALI